jgi:hypothetical protein
VRIVETGGACIFAIEQCVLSDCYLIERARVEFSLYLGRE